MKFKVTQFYTAQQVSEMLTQAAGYPCSVMEVSNMARPGKALHRARTRNDVYRRRQVMEVMQAVLRRRLCAELGRTSPRFPDVDVEISCPECGGMAVQWEYKWLCEEGHTGEFIPPPPPEPPKKEYKGIPV